VELEIRPEPRDSAERDAIAAALEVPPDQVEPGRSAWWYTGLEEAIVPFET
jgi:predicted PhzF superfamily epimerase YddE/YHI9